MEITIRHLNKDYVMDMVQAEAFTMGRNPIVVSPRDRLWWEQRIVAQHSSLRCVRFRVQWWDISSTVAHQLVRATTGMTQCLMKSSRPDITGKPRPQGIYSTNLMIDTDAEGWLHLAQQRRCRRAEAETRDAVDGACVKMFMSNDPYFVALSVHSSPRCDSLGECPEIQGCGLYPPMVPRVPWGNLEDEDAR